jgi:hypothetical protein
VGRINPRSLRKFGEIAGKCWVPQGTGRPEMPYVRWNLEYALQIQKTAVHDPV